MSWTRANYICIGIGLTGLTIASTMGHGWAFGFLGFWVGVLLGRLEKWDKRAASIDRAKILQAQYILRSWEEQQDHERCWYYPEVFRQLTKALGSEPTRMHTLPSRPEFEAGCKKYQDEQYGDRP